MKNKNIAYITAAAAVIGLIALSAAHGGASAHKAGGMNETASGVPMYILKTHGGQVCVFEYGSNDIAEILSVRADDLPEADRAALSSGVAVYSDEELQKRIEDYDS